MWQKIRVEIEESIRTGFPSILILGYWLYSRGLLRSIYHWVMGLLRLR
jgi:hypothetical protein